MKVLLAGYGTRGDVQPLVALGVRLRADGHEVAIGASGVFADWVGAHGLGFHTIGGDIQALVQSHAEVLTRRPALLMMRLLDDVREEVALAFEQTLAAARGADMIVAGVHSAAPSVAEALGLPHRTLLFCPQMIPSRHHPPMGVPWLSLPERCNQLLWWAARRGFDVVLRDALNHHRHRWGLPPISDVADYLITDSPIVASDGLLGELPSDASPWIQQTGSLPLAADGAIEPALERFLAEGEVPVYIGFGSMPDHDPRRTTQMLVGALDACQRRGIISSGWAGLGEGGVPSSVFVARSTPHALLLPRVALAVHHGGAGTTAAAARAGIPQVVVPHIADQYYWGLQAHRRGLGSRPIPRTSLTTARLVRAIRGVLSSPRIAERARGMKTGMERSDGVAALAQGLYEVACAPRADRLAA